MLVLSRKVGERIFVGDQVTITVVRITGGGVRLGIEAPPELAVVREELRKQGKQAEVPSNDAPSERARGAESHPDSKRQLKVES